MMVIGSTETNANIVDRQISADNKEKREILEYMGNNTKENRRKKKEREKSQFWTVKASFVAGRIGI